LVDGKRDRGKATTMSYSKRCLAAVLLVITSISSVHAAELSGLLGNVGEDFTYLATSPARLDKESALITLGIVGATGILYWQDQNIRHYFQDHKTSTLDDLSPIVEKFGVFGGDLAFLALYGGTGYLAQNEKMKETALLSLESFAVAGAINVAVKAGVGRARPDVGEGKSSFKPFAVDKLMSGDLDYTSFPSGHTVDAFSIASVFADSYDSPWVGITAYGLASLVCLQRIYADRHWASDVFAGAVLGTVVGKSVVYLHKNKNKNSVYLAPIVDPLDGRFGLMLVKRF
jgi:membrane-associated phospholipid phosphatase